MHLSCEVEDESLYWRDNGYLKQPLLCSKVTRLVFSKWLRVVGLWLLIKKGFMANKVCMFLALRSVEYFLH